MTVRKFERSAFRIVSISIPVASGLRFTDHHLSTENNANAIMTHIPEEAKGIQMNGGVYSNYC